MAKIGIFTNFMEFNPGYSLSGIVVDQANMLTKNGHEVTILVNEQFHGKTDGLFSPQVQIRKKTPFTHLVDYHRLDDLADEHKTIAAKTKLMLEQWIMEFGIDVMFTHDIIFTGWNLPYAQGIIGAGKNIPWFHWIHSIPTAYYDWWSLTAYGDNHTIVYPNVTDRDRVATQYRTSSSRIRAVPHIKDIRSFFDFKDETNDLIAAYPGLMQADIVQIYPAGCDRLDAKRVKELLNIFKYFKALGKSVFLLIANQWANTLQRKQCVEDYHLMAKMYGLTRDDYAFTSEYQSNRYETGLPRGIIRELMMLANVFIFPTREETFGLVFPEMALASGALCVLNRSLRNQAEISGMKAIYHDFGAYDMNFRPDHGSWDLYARNLAVRIIDAMANDHAVQTKTWVRQRYNMDAVYQQHYLPMVGNG